MNSLDLKRAPGIAHMVSDHVIADAAAYAAAFQAAKPFRHVVIDNFLAPDIARRMVDEFPSETDPGKLLNEFGIPNPKKAISNVSGIGGVYADMDQLIQTKGFLDLVGQVVGIPDLRYDPDYFGAGTHENFHGAGLDAHYDFNILPTTGQHRRINAIIYLNEEWRPEWGGSICFHSNPWDLENDEVIEVLPVVNRCVIFETTESSWHSVPAIRLPESERHRSRKSFTIYLYTDTRPPEETAPSHGTVYVQEGLPKHIAAGHTLSADDVAVISGNIRRRHDYLRQMYRREYRFGETIESLRTQLIDWKRSSNVPVLGYGKVLSVEEPLYTDGWMGHALKFRVRPVKPVTGLKLKAWWPADSRSMQVSLSAGGSRKEISTEGGQFEIELPFESAESADLDVSVELSGARRPVSGGDLRALSAILDSIELLHDAQ